MTKKLLLVGMLLLSFLAAACGSGKDQPVDNKASATKTIVDEAGRSVTVPANIRTVYSISPVGTIFMYTLAPDKIIGRNWEAAAGEKKFTLASYQQLPVLGGSFGKDKIMNKEEVIKANPDIILQMGDIDSLSVSNADALQKQLNIPVVVVGLNLESMDKAYTFMGSVLGAEEKAKELAEYCKQTIAEVKAKAVAIPVDKRVKVYYAEGNEGLETDPKGSAHAEVLDLAGGVNIADVTLQKGYGRTQVSIEQVLHWNPQLILVCYDQGFQAQRNPYLFLQEDASWQQVQAVQQKRVFQIPYAPFNWFDRPPSVNRIIGIKWLAHLLYPDQFPYDMKEETKRFYKLFYHVDISDQDVDEILKYSR